MIPLLIYIHAAFPISSWEAEKEKKMLHALSSLLIGSVSRIQSGGRSLRGVRAKLREVPSIRSAAVEVASSLYRVSALVSALE